MSAPATPERWVTAAVLAALVGRGLGAGGSFAGSSLAQWLDGKLTAEQRQRATTRLCALRFVTHRACVVDGARDMQYTVTADGAAAIAEAARGHVRKSGPKGTRTGRPPAPDTYAARLWSLLRIRKVITAAEAAQLLVDAGGPVQTRTSTARKYLRRWSTTGAVRESAQRVNRNSPSNGEKRYVLLVDSPTPPHWYAGARAGAAS